MQNLVRQGKDESCSKDVDGCVDWGCAQIVKGQTFAIDQMDVCIGNRHITGAVVCYFGLTGEVDIVAESLRWMGPARFDVAGVLQMLKGTSCGRTRVSYVDADGRDKEIVDDFVTCVVGNTQYWTDVMRASPNSVLDDGLIEVMLVKRACPNFVMLRMFLLIESGAHVNCPICRPYLEVLQVRRVRFDFLGASGPNAGVFNVDGEIFRHPGTVDIRCVERALPVFASDAQQY
jgi:diacylglycerol kinase family enzyme